MNFKLGDRVALVKDGHIIGTVSGFDKDGDPQVDWDGRPPNVSFCYLLEKLRLLTPLEELL